MVVADAAVRDATLREVRPVEGVTRQLLHPHPAEAPEGRIRLDGVLLGVLVPVRKNPFPIDDMHELHVIRHPNARGRCGGEELVDSVRAPFVEPAAALVHEEAAVAFGPRGVPRRLVRDDRVRPPRVPHAVVLDHLELRLVLLHVWAASQLATRNLVPASTCAERGIISPARSRCPSRSVGW